MDYRPAESLIPYARNARTHSERQVGEIAASIREFGWTNPILVDGESGIVAGHGRPVDHLPAEAETGPDRAAELVQDASKSGRTLREVARDPGVDGAVLDAAWRERGFGDFWGYALLAEGAAEKRADYDTGWGSVLGRYEARL